MTDQIQRCSIEDAPIASAHQIEALAATKIIEELKEISRVNTLILMELKSLSGKNGNGGQLARSG